MRHISPEAMVFMLPEIPVSRIIFRRPASGAGAIVEMHSQKGEEIMISEHGTPDPVIFTVTGVVHFFREAGLFSGEYDDVELDVKQYCPPGWEHVQRKSVERFGDIRKRVETAMSPEEPVRQDEELPQSRFTTTIYVFDEAHEAPFTEEREEAVPVSEKSAEDLEAFGRGPARERQERQQVWESAENQSPESPENQSLESPERQENQSPESPERQENARTLDIAEGLKRLERLGRQEMPVELEDGEEEEEEEAVHHNIGEQYLTTVNKIRLTSLLIAVVCTIIMLVPFAWQMRNILTGLMGGWIALAILFWFMERSNPENPSLRLYRYAWLCLVIFSFSMSLSYIVSGKMLT